MAAAGVLAFLGLALALAASPARAASPAAEAAFQAGRQLLAAGSLEAACARFGESYALEASSGALLNLALCHERQDRTATAFAEYGKAALLARRQGRADRALAAEQRATGLYPRLARLTALAGNPVAPGIIVATERGALSEAGLGVAVPVDPGTHRLTANAPGYHPWTTTLEIRDGEQRIVEIPALEQETAPGTEPSPARPGSPARAAAGAPAPPTRPAVAAREPPNLNAYLAVSGGALVLAGGLIWSVAYAEFRFARDGTCGQLMGCADRDSRAASIQTLEKIAIGSWIGGGALLLLSGIRYELGERRTRERPLVVSIDPVQRAFAVGAAF